MLWVKIGRTDVRGGRCQLTCLRWMGYFDGPVETPRTGTVRALRLRLGMELAAWRLEVSVSRLTNNVSK